MRWRFTIAAAGFTMVAFLTVGLMPGLVGNSCPIALSAAMPPEGIPQKGIRETTEEMVDRMMVRLNGPHERECSTSARRLLLQTAIAGIGLVAAVAVTERLIARGSTHD